jgi:hypothetical protein
VQDAQRKGLGMAVCFTSKSGTPAHIGVSGYRVGTPGGSPMLQQGSTLLRKGSSGDGVELRPRADVLVLDRATGSPASPSRSSLQPDNDF